MIFFPPMKYEISYAIWVVRSDFYANIILAFETYSDLANSNIFKFQIFK